MSQIYAELSKITERRGRDESDLCRMDCYVLRRAKAMMLDEIGIVELNAILSKLLVTVHCVEIHHRPEHQTDNEKKR